ncbi:MAG TPA: hypothetical protein VHX49_06905 [Candidatus Acidoferrales bacterium]|jgi:hypothetical protein|nr:hypothetical protein [Candidatus Acidoferrales bacterium]
MRHFPLEQWIDFARHVVGPRERAEMETHLNDGCKQCSKTLSLWQRVGEVGRREAAYAPPENVVATMKGTFAIHGPRKAAGRARAIASVLFDSASTPLVAGVRSSGTAERQLLYGVSNYRIDVRIEPQHNSEKVALVGQVLNSRAPEESIGAVPVRLCRGRKVLVESITSAFGEFDIECDLAKGLELKVTLATEELCLPLVEATIKATSGSPEPPDSKRFKAKELRDSKRTRKKV